MLSEPIRKRVERNTRYAMCVWVKDRQRRDGGYWLNTSPDCPHGEWGGYNNWGCRCTPCTAANTEKKAKQSGRRTGDADIKRAIVEEFRAI